MSWKKSYAKTLFNGGFNLDALTEECAESLDTPPGSISTSGMNVTFEFAIEPSVDDKNALDVVVASHNGAPPSDLRIALLSAAPVVDHRQLDYKTQLTARLHKKITSFFRGELRQVVYYTDATETVPVLKVDVQYTRAPNGLAVSRTTTRTWYRVDGTEHPLKKLTTKVYDTLGMVAEGKRRRGNVVDKLTLDVLSMLVVTETAGDITAAEAIGAAYIAKYDSHLGVYRQTGSLAFKALIAVDTESWLDNDLASIGMPGVTIRMVILDSLREITDV